MERTKAKAFQIYSTYMSNMAIHAAQKADDPQLLHTLQVSGHKTREAYFCSMILYAYREVEKLWRAHEKQFPN